MRSMACCECRRRQTSAGASLAILAAPGTEAPYQHDFPILSVDKCPPRPRVQEVCGRMATANEVCRQG